MGCTLRFMIPACELATPLYAERDVLLLPDGGHIFYVKLYDKADIFIVSGPCNRVEPTRYQQEVRLFDQLLLDRYTGSCDILLNKVGGDLDRYEFTVEVSTCLGRIKRQVGNLTVINRGSVYFNGVPVDLNKLHSLYVKAKLFYDSYV